LYIGKSPLVLEATDTSESDANVVAIGEVPDDPIPPTFLNNPPCKIVASLN
jgi:hypothetical protein